MKHTMEDTFCPQGGDCCGWAGDSPMGALRLSTLVKDQVPGRLRGRDPNHPREHFPNSNCGPTLHQSERTTGRARRCSHPQGDKEVARGTWHHNRVWAHSETPATKLNEVWVFLLASGVGGGTSPPRPFLEMEGDRPSSTLGQRGSKNGSRSGLPNPRSCALMSGPGGL